MRSFFFGLVLLTVGLIACQTERPPTAEPIAVVLTATSSPTATGTAAPPTMTASHTPSPTATLTNTPRPTRTPTSTPTVTPTFTPYPTPLPTATPAPTLPASSRSLDLTLVAQTGGEATGLALSADGRLAYITVGPRLQVYDVADRANPTLQWQSDVFRRSFVGLMVEGEFAFGRLVDGWVVWRLSAVPELLWVSEPEVIQDPARGERRRWTFLEEQVYLGISQDEWLVFDMSTPVFPLPMVTQAGQIYELEDGLVIRQGTAEQTTFLFAEDKTLPANVIGKLEVDGRHHILTDYQSSDLANPTVLASDLPNYFEVAEEDGLWIGLQGERSVYDVASNPLQPLLLSTFSNDPILYHPLIWKENQMLFISMFGDAGYISVVLHLLNIQDMQKPQEDIVYHLPPLPFKKAQIFGDTLFVLQSAQLTLLDISNLAQIEEISHVEMLGASSMAVLADETIISFGHNYGDFARSIPRQFSDAVVAIERIPLDAGYSLDFHQNTLFTIRDVAGIEHYHLPSQQLYSWPSRELRTVSSGTRFASYGEYVVAIDDQKLVVIDLTEPSEPAIIGRYDSPRVQGRTNSLNHMRLIHSIAFISSSYELTAVDLAAPTQPQEIGYWPMDEYISSLFSIGEVLYVGEGNGNTLVFDVSTPTEPRLVQTIGTPISGHLYGDFLIGDTYIYDVADPLNPLLVGEAGVYGRIIGIRDNLLYVGSSAGVYVYEIGVRP
ncbi:MAG: hypothetical protein OT477_18255 [Chloroflexi bacterium]|nr:hypothetical protein [Chloroflexota bacterium]